MFRKIIDHKWKEVTLSCRKSHTALHFSPNHIRMIKSRQMKGAVHTAHMGENEKQHYKGFGKKTLKKIFFEVLDIH
jgi:hypothetical protein